MCGLEGGAYLQNFIILNKLSKAARAKRNKASENAASFSKMVTSNKSLSEIFNTKVSNTFKLIQEQQKRSHMKCFYSIVFYNKILIQNYKFTLSNLQ